MKKQFYKIFYLFLVLFILCTCKNEPIFYRIALEYEQRDPIIAGSPTNFAEFNDTLFIASGNKLYYYEGTNEEGYGIWKNIELSGVASAIASTDELLYVLQTSTNRNVVQVYNSALESESLPFNENIISIFTANNELFICGEVRNFYTIYHYNGTEFVNLLPEPTGRIMRGALVHNGEYYFCTSSIQSETDGALYKSATLEEGSAVAVAEKPADSKTSYSFVGMIHIGETIAVITRDGHIYNENGDPYIAGYNEGTPIYVNLGGYKATGGLAVYEEKDEDNNVVFSLLLAGRQDELKYSTSSGYTYGYLEIELSEGNVRAGETFHEPGKVFPSSIENFERYSSSLGKYPVIHLAQAKDGILFAATQQHGVWSYRLRHIEGFSTWNAED